MFVPCRAAGRCNKGFRVLYSVAVEHYIQVAVVIERGPAHADASVALLRQLLHCQMCAAFAVCPNTKAPLGK